MVEVEGEQLFSNLNWEVRYLYQFYKASWFGLERDLRLHFTSTR
jgi:hypothetical protein